jgi:hypothetical protein
MWDALQVVGSVEGDGGSQPSEEREHGWLSRVDLMTWKLLAVLRVISHRSTKDHEVASCF